MAKPTLAAAGMQGEKQVADKWLIIDTIFTLLFLFCNVFWVNFAI
jgi:hypothetical protein